MTQSIAGEINSVNSGTCMTKEGCTFILTISTNDVKLAINNHKLSLVNQAGRGALSQAVIFMVLIYYIITLHCCLPVC